MDALRILCFLWLAGTLSLSAQETRIRWEPELRLQWSDFQANPPDSKQVAATTASGISYYYNAIGHSNGYRLDFQVDTYFYPDKSWYHPEICDAVILSHEQLHFDIAELFAREFRRRLSGRTFSRTVKSEVRSIFEEINRELSDFQNTYDQETDYSRDREAQMRWNRSIAERLNGEGG